MPPFFCFSSMKKIAFQVFAVSLIFSTVSFSQDLNRLQERAQKLLALRSSDKKAEAAQYIDTKSREAFLEEHPFPMRDAHVTGFEFTNDSKVVYVLFKANVILPELGPVPRTGREPWVWDKKDWFLSLSEEGQPTFPTTLNPPPAKPLPLELAQSHVDMGKHIQGDIVRQKVSFKSDKNQIFLFRTSGDLPGVSLSTPVWKSNEEGEIEVVLDTLLLSKDVKYDVELEVQGNEGQKTHASFDLIAQIEPRFRISQIPDIVDPAQAGTVEIEMENLSAVPYDFLSLSSLNPAYEIKGEIPENIKPGQTVKLTLSYPAQSEPLGAQVNVRISKPIGGRQNLTFPLQIKLPTPSGPGFTKEQFDEILRKAKQ